MLNNSRFTGKLEFDKVAVKENFIVARKETYNLEENSAS